LRLSCFAVYIGRTELKIKFAKLSIAAETYYNKSYVQMTRWAPTRHDNIDYKPIIISTPKYPSTVRRYSCWGDMIVKIVSFSKRALACIHYNPSSIRICTNMGNACYV